MSDQVEGGKQGRFAKMGAAVKKAADDAQAGRGERTRQDQESYGNVVKSAEFGGQKVEIYGGGYVRVGGLSLSGKAPVEKLKSIKYSTQIQDKSLGGRAAAGVATLGVSFLTSKEKRVLFLTIVTDQNVHTLKDAGDMGRNNDQAGMALEAAGQAVLEALAPAAGSLAPPPPPPAAPAQPDIADQIKKLADLHTAGVLTDEEFAAKKTDLLSRM